MRRIVALAAVAWAFAAGAGRAEDLPLKADARDVAKIHGLRIMAKADRAATGFHKKGMLVVSLQIENTNAHPVEVKGYHFSEKNIASFAGASLGKASPAAEGFDGKGVEIAALGGAAVKKHGLWLRTAGNGGGDTKAASLVAKPSSFCKVVLMFPPVEGESYQVVVPAEHVGAGSCRIVITFGEKDITDARNP